MNVHTRTSMWVHLCHDVAQVPSSAQARACMAPIRAAVRSAAKDGFMQLFSDGHQLMLARIPPSVVQSSTDTYGSAPGSEDCWARLPDALRNVIPGVGGVCVDVFSPSWATVGAPCVPQLVRRVFPALRPCVSSFPPLVSPTVSLNSLSECAVNRDGSRRWHQVVNVVDVSRQCTISKPGSVSGWFIHCKEGGVARFRVWRRVPRSRNVFALVGENVEVSARVVRVRLRAHRCVSCAR